MINTLQGKNLQTGAELWNVFKAQKATPEQAHDLLNFRQIGQGAFVTFVTEKLLGLPSTAAPTRRKRLCTFTVSKTQKRKIKLIEQEQKISQKFLKRQLAWISEHGIENVDTNSLLGPISAMPRALMDSNGLPYKAPKHNTTEFLQKRYHSQKMLDQSLPPQWVPDSVILEGMFMIQTTPLPSMGTLQDYARFLLNQYVRPHLRLGVKEVHVIFDSPGSMKETPKEIEQRRRDSSEKGSHECTPIASTSAPPSNWRNLLGCRRCNQALTQYLADEMLKLAVQVLRGSQTFVSNAREVAYVASSNGEVLPSPRLWSNADEANLRLWLHCVHSSGTKKLIFSPDTDIYHIGLTAASVQPDSEVIVQLSKSLKKGTKFI